MNYDIQVPFLLDKNISEQPFCSKKRKNDETYKVNSRKVEYGKIKRDSKEECEIIEDSDAEIDDTLLSSSEELLCDIIEDSELDEMGFEAVVSSQVTLSTTTATRDS